MTTPSQPNPRDTAYEAMRQVILFQRDFTKHANGDMHCNACNGDPRGDCVESADEQRFRPGRKCARRELGRLTNAALRALEAADAAAGSP